jgi:REP element-mobilizing transposase RayT
MHSFNSCLMHCVFSTKDRRPWLSPAIRERLWPYLGGIARENDMKALAIGGVGDHVHLFLSLPATLSVSKAMQLLKGNSSKWLRETFSELRPQGFAWQEGFGAFSIGVSGVEDTIHYLIKHTAINSLCRAVRGVLKGKTFFKPLPPGYLHKQDRKKKNRSPPT